MNLIACTTALAAAGALAHVGQPVWPDLDGRSFADVDLPLVPLRGTASFSATKAWIWTEPDGTRRLVLDGRVRIELAGYPFAADRAFVWLDRRRDDPDAPVYQVYAVLEGVDGAAPGRAISFEGDVVPVEGVLALDEPVRLRVGASAPSRPGPGALGDALAAAEARFARRLRVIAGLDEAAEIPGPERPALPEPARGPEVGRRPGMGETDRPADDPPAQPGAQQDVERDVEQQAGRAAAREAPPDPGPGVAEPRATEPRAAEPRIGEPGSNDPGSDDPRIADAFRLAGRTAIEPAPPPDAGSPIFSSDGVFYIAVGERIVAQPAGAETTAVLTGGVVVQYRDNRNNRLELRAQRGVVFLRDSAPGGAVSQVDADDVEGLYLEGGVVASDGTYTLRGPRVYYDVRANRALVLDAVFWTYEQRTGLPLYLRAEAVRQEAADQFSARRAQLANTSFFEPTFSIGVRDVTVTVSDPPEDYTGIGGRVHVDADGITLEAGGLPFLWLPGYDGDPEQFPLRGIRGDNSNRTGPGVRTRWNAFALVNMPPPPGVDAEVALDWFDDSGFGLGAEVRWDRPDQVGKLWGYTLPDDNGRDLMTNGTEIERDGEFRGLVRAEHRWQFLENWTMFAEASYISDEALFLSAFRRESETERELTNRVVLRRLEDNSALFIEGKAQANDFIANQNLLQSPGYLVDKLPEVRYVRAADDLLGDLAPGLLTHTWEASNALMRLRFSEVTAESQGFDRLFQARNALGVDPDESIGDALRAQGLDEDFVNRFDSRHELSAQLGVGPLAITPFVVGRFTHYDTEFSAFSPQEDDNARWWGSAGVTVATSVSRIDESIESSVLDLHRMRHIVEPSITLWTAHSTIEEQDLPVFDDDVEGLIDGNAVRVALDQTWQTKRGGPGRWRNVDVFTLDTEYVWMSEEAGESEIPRFFPSRPELSNPGSYARVRATWQVSEAVALAGESTYSLDTDQQARSSVGALVQHTPEFSTTGELRFLNPQDVTYGRASARYRLTDKYSVSGAATYNFDLDDFQSVNADFYRLFPQFALGVSVGFDNIRNETSFGFLIQPVGAPGAVGQRRGSVFGR